MFLAAAAWIFSCVAFTISRELSIMVISENLSLSNSLSLGFIMLAPYIVIL